MTPDLSDVRYSYDGDLFIFGGHFALDELKADAMFWDDYGDRVIRVEHTYARNGFVNFDGERVNGWNIVEGKPKSNRGLIKVTEVVRRRYVSPEGGRGQ